jgi:hypothetical protein
MKPKSSDPAKASKGQERVIPKHPHQNADKSKSLTGLRYYFVEDVIFPL